MGTIDGYMKLATTRIPRQAKEEKRRSETADEEREGR
jgi:hypothetical protein